MCGIKHFGKHLKLHKFYCPRDIDANSNGCGFRLYFAIIVITFGLLWTLFSSARPKWAPHLSSGYLCSILNYIISSIIRTFCETLLILVKVIDVNEQTFVRFPAEKNVHPKARLFCCCLNILHSTRFHRFSKFFTINFFYFDFLVKLKDKNSHAMHVGGRFFFAHRSSYSDQMHSFDCVLSFVAV